MKRSLLLMFAAALLVGVSCERQEFDGPDGTRKLHEHHSGASSHHGAADADAHGHPHGEAKDGAHGEAAH